MAKGGVRIPILSEFKPQGIDKAIKEFKKLESNTDKIAFGLKKAFVPALAVTAGLAAGFVKLSLAAETAATSNARIVQITESMGLFGSETQVVTDRLIALAEATARNTGVDQNAIKETQAKLLTFKEIAVTADEVGGSFDRATAAAIDLASAGFGEATTNAVQLGKALNDPITGMSALARSGITFTEQEKDRIKILVESNEMGEAQAMILEAIEKQVGGTAEATANASDKMAVSFSIMQESLGRALLPIFEKFTDIAIVLFDFIGRNDTVFLVVAAGAGALAAAIVLANVAMKIHAGLQMGVKIANAVLGTSFQLTAAKMAKFTGGLALVGAAIGVAMFAYSLYRNEKQRLVEITADFTAGLTAERDGQEGATNAAIGATLATEDMQKRMELLGLTNADVAKAIRGEVSPAFDDFAEKMAFGMDKTAAGDENMRRLTASFGDNVGAARAVSAEVDRLRGSFEEASEQVARTEKVTSDLTASEITATTSTDNFSAASKALSDSMAAAERAMGKYDDSVRAADESLMRLIDTTLAMFSADLNLQSQIARTEEAIFDYTAAIADGSLKGRELEAVQRDVKTEALRQAAAAVQAAEAQAELAGTSLDASERQKILVDNLSAVARALAPGDPLRRELATYIEQLGAVPRDVVTRFTNIRQEIIQTSIVEAAQFSPGAIAAASRNAPRISRQVGGPIPGPTGLGVPTLAHGGEFVLSADVVDAIKHGRPTLGLGRGGGGGGGGGNVINITVTSADPQAVVDAIRRYNRTNGPAPIRVA